MASPLTLTPCRGLDFDEDEMKFLVTPEVKKDFRQLFDDEDSGLGMDDHTVRYLINVNGNCIECHYTQICYYIRSYRIIEDIFGVQSYNIPAVLKFSPFRRRTCM